LTPYYFILSKYTHYQNKVATKYVHQTTLKGEIIQEYTYYVLGFVPADVVRLKKDVWFSKLSSKQITSVEKYLSHNNFLGIKS